MAQFVDRSQTSIGAAKGNKQPAADALVPPSSSILAQKWRGFLAGPRLPRSTALAIIQVSALLFWLGVVVGIYYLLRH